MLTRALLLTIALLVFCPQVQCAYPQTEFDFARLPRFCWVRLKGPASSPEQQYWSKRIGPDFIHMHHYCEGMFSAMLARVERDPMEKKQLYKASIGGYSYVEEHSSPNFAWRPRIHYEKGQVFEETGQLKEAVQEYQSAIKLNPKLTLAYAALSDLAVRSGRPAEAIEVLQKGLEQKPDSKMLLRRMGKLKKNK